jgi:hypothetical protein
MLMSMADEAAKGVPGADADPPELVNGTPDQSSRN